MYEQGIAVQLSNGDGTFQAPQVIQTYSSTTAPTGAPPVVGSIGDATGSGKLDLVHSENNDEPTSGSTTFAAAVSRQGRRDVWIRVDPSRGR